MRTSYTIALSIMLLTSFIFPLHGQGTANKLISIEKEYRSQLAQAHGNQKAQFQAGKDKTKKLQNLIENAPEIERLSAQDLFSLAIAFEGVQDFEHCLATAQELIKKAPQHAQGNALLIRMSLKNSPIEHTQQTIQQALERTSNLAAISPYWGALGIKSAQDNSPIRSIEFFTHYLDARFQLATQDINELGPITAVLPLVQKQYFATSNEKGFKSLLADYRTQLEQFSESINSKKLENVRDLEQRLTIQFFLSELDSFLDSPKVHSRLEACFELICKFPELVNGSQASLLLFQSNIDQFLSASHTWKDLNQTDQLISRLQSGFENINSTIDKSILAVVNAQLERIRKHHTALVRLQSLCSSDSVAGQLVAGSTSSSTAAKLPSKPVLILWFNENSREPLLSITDQIAEIAGNTDIRLLVCTSKKEPNLYNFELLIEKARTRNPDIAVFAGRLPEFIDKADFANEAAIWTLVHEGNLIAMQLGCSPQKLGQLIWTSK